MLYILGYMTNKKRNKLPELKAKYYKNKFEDLNDDDTMVLLTRFIKERHIWKKVCDQLDCGYQYQAFCRLHRPKIWAKYVWCSDRLDIEDDTIINAIENEVGLISRAARVLGMSFGVLNRRISNSDDLKEAVESVRMSIHDDVMSKLYANIEMCNQKAIEYYLDHQGGPVGYGEKSSSIEETVNPMDSIQTRLKQLPDSKLRELQKIVDKQQKIIDVEPVT